MAYEGFSSPMLVLDGKAYYSVRYPPWYGWYCVDLYTGETLYYENNTLGTAAMPAFGEVLTMDRLTNTEASHTFGGHLAYPYQQAQQVVAALKLGKCSIHSQERPYAK